MRADTHDGPEQMLHVRGLIHCCSSHVRRSWNSVLQRTAGPYILALMRPSPAADERPILARNRTSCSFMFTPLMDAFSGPASIAPKKSVKRVLRLYKVPEA